MLRSYISRCRPELLALIKNLDEPAWQQIIALPVDEQIERIAAHREVKAGIAHHVLSQAGFEPGSVIQHRMTRNLYHLSYPIISMDSEGVPVHVVMYGREVDKESMSPRYLGRLEDFVSTSTGKHVVPTILLDLIPKI